MPPMYAVQSAEAGASLNCSLDNPPSRSGEMASEGIESRIFPRTKAMGRHYSGCQSVWFLDTAPRRALLQLRLVFENGEIVRLTVYSLETKEIQSECRYRAHKLVSGDSSCLDFPDANQPIESLPPGCLEKMYRSSRGSDEPCFNDLG